MSQTKNSIRSFDKIRTDLQNSSKNASDGEVNACNNTERCTYAVTVSKKPSPEDDLSQGQKSFISIHSTDQLFQVPETHESPSLDECNVEVLSLNEVFPSTSEESVSNDDDVPVAKKKNEKRSSTKPKAKPQKNVNSSSFTQPEQKRPKEPMEGPVKSNIELPKNTLTVIGSNPGEPKIAYKDPPKKVSKTMKKFLRNIEKHKNEHGAKGGEKVVSKLTTMRGILKMQPCGPECTGDSALDTEDFNPENFDFAMAFGPQGNNTKQNADKNVTFNTQVVIIHFSGDLCLGQSVESLSKEKDQQARNSELRKTFLSKYNEFWPTQK